MIAETIYTTRRAIGGFCAGCRAALPLVGFGFGLIALLSATGCTKPADATKTGMHIEEKIREKPLPSEDTQTETAREVEMLYSDSAVVRAKLRAPLMLHSLDPTHPNRIFPKGLTVDFFDRLKKPASKLVADYGERDEATTLVTLRGNVRMDNVKHETLETTELYFNEARQTMYSDKPVRITTPTEIINGVGFESNSDFSHWVIRKVTGNVEAGNVLGDE